MDHALSVRFVASLFDFEVDLGLLLFFYERDKSLLEGVDGLVKVVIGDA